MKKLETLILNLIRSITLKKPLNRQLFFWLVAILSIFWQFFTAGYQGGHLSLIQLVFWYIILFLFFLFLIINFK